MNSIVCCVVLEINTTVDAHLFIVLSLIQQSLHLYVIDHECCLRVHCTQHAWLLVVRICDEFPFEREPSPQERLATNCCLRQST